MRTDVNTALQGDEVPPRSTTATTASLPIVRQDETAASASLLASASDTVPRSRGTIVVETATAAGSSRSMLATATGLPNSSDAIDGQAGVSFRGTSNSHRG